jgi:ubiquitin-conjugating enzyme (huntingtin interacting protein 2)
MDSLKNRIMKEYEDLQKSKKENQIEVWLIDDNLKHWKGKIQGSVNKLITQSDTPYEGGEYTVDIVIPEDYPFKPPKVKSN